MEEAIPHLEEALQASEKYRQLEWVRKALRDAYRDAKRTEEFVKMVMQN